VHKKRYHGQKSYNVNFFSRIDFYKPNKNRRKYEHGHNERDIPINHDPAIPIIKQDRTQYSIVKRVLWPEIEFRKRGFDDQGKDDGKNGQNEVRKINVLEFLFQKLAIHEFGIEHMMEKKSRNENKKGRSA
jgi:hypothetical protein